MLTTIPTLKAKGTRGVEPDPLGTIDLKMTKASSAKQWRTWKLKCTMTLARRDMARPVSRLWRMFCYDDISWNQYKYLSPTTSDNNKIQWRITSATYCKYSMLSSDWGEQQQQQEETNKKHGNNSNCDFSNAQFRMPLRTNILAQANCFGQGYGESSLSTLSPGCGWQKGPLHLQDTCEHRTFAHITPTHVHGTLNESRRKKKRVYREVSIRMVKELQG